MNGIDVSLWIVTAVAELVSIWLCRNRYPHLRNYLGFCVIRDVVLAAAWPLISDPHYAYLYFTLQAVSVILQFNILAWLTKESGLGVWPAVIGMLGVLLMPQAGPAGVAVYMVASAQRAIFTGRMLAWAVVWIRQNDLEPTSRRVMNGFGMMAGAELAIAGVKTQFGVFGSATLNHLQIGFFIVMLVMWIAALARREEQ